MTTKKCSKDKFLIVIPRGYEAGYVLTRFNGANILTKPGMPALVMVDRAWIELKQ